MGFVIMTNISLIKIGVTMAQEKLKQDLGQLYAAVLEHNATMTQQHDSNKAEGAPVLNPIFWFVDQETLKSSASQHFASFGAIQFLSDAVLAAQKLIIIDMDQMSTKDFNSVFYASLKEFEIPDTFPQDLLMDFYSQLHGQANDADEGFEG